MDTESWLNLSADQVECPERRPGRVSGPLAGSQASPWAPVKGILVYTSVLVSFTVL